MPPLSPQATLPLALALLAWLGLGLGFLLWARPGSGARARRDPRARLGLVVQALAFSVGFVFRRSPTVEPPAWELALGWLGALLAWGSVALAVQAARVLGRHWSLDARVLDGHRLVESGPYGIVRHPIYTAMLGLCLGTGLNLMRWWALAPAVAVYLFGTWLRTRSEEALLLAELGDEYARYAARVPALFPWRFARRGPDKLSA